MNMKPCMDSRLRLCFISSKKLDYAFVYYYNIVLLFLL